MSLINLVREAAYKRNSDKEKLQQLEDLDAAMLRIRLLKLKELVLNEVRQFDQEECKYGKFVVHIDNSEIHFSTVGQLVAWVTIPDSDKNSLVLELRVGIDVGEIKFSETDSPTPYKVPTVWAKIYSPTDHLVRDLSCTDSEGSAQRFFIELSQSLLKWF